MREYWYSPALGTFPSARAQTSRATGSFVPRLMAAEGPLGIHPSELVEANDRGDLGLLPCGGLELALWCDLRIATEGSKLRLSRASLGRAFDRRGHSASAAHRRPWSRPGSDPHRQDHRCRRGAFDGSDHRDRSEGEPSTAGIGDGRGPCSLPAADDARGPPRRDRRHGHDAGGRTRARVPSRA